jgi:hypothetical protein
VGVGGGAIACAVSARRSGTPLSARAAARRLDPKRFPTVDGQLTSLTPLADGSYAGAGWLTFHGVTRQLAGVLWVRTGEGEVRLTGTATIDVTEYGVQPPSLLVVKVHKEVQVTLDAVAVPSAG